MKKVLVVMAHPDDEVLGCGGTIARMADEGAQVRIIICGEGLSSRGETTKAELERLNDELTQAASILGVEDVLHLDWPDNRFDQRPLLDLVQAIETAALSLAPDVIITHHVGDLNIDHVYVHNAVMTCFRPLPGRAQPMILTAEIGSSTGWSAPDADSTFMPTVFSDIGSSLDRKIQAMEIYSSEKAKWPHPRSPEAIKAAAEYWGSRFGLAAVEPFVLVRQYI